MVLLDALGFLMQQITGFFLWLALWPLEAVAVFFDPVLAGSCDGVLDFIRLVTDGFAGLRSVFADVNYFFPFYAFVGIISAVWVFEFVLILGEAVALSFGADVRGLLRGIVGDIVVGILDSARNILLKVLTFFFGSRG